MMIQSCVLVCLYYVLILTKTAASLHCPQRCECLEYETVRCHFPELSYFPSNFPPNTTILDLTDNNIRHITAGSLNGLDMLAELNLTNNKVYAIDEKAFQGGGNVEKIDVSDNNIYFLPKNAFFDLSNLREIDLSENRLQEFPNFVKNTRLEKLSLSNNRIAIIPEGALKQHTKMQEIYLKSLDLRILSRGVFADDVSNFTIVDFSKNRLWSTPSVVREMKNLEKLCLSYNPIKIFEAKDFRPLNTLTTLEMANVGMKEVPGSLFWLPMLKHLDISQNEISGGSLKNIQFSNLLTLKLTSNPIQVVGDDAFDGIKNLESLDASDCDISVIHARTFAFLLKLKKVNLSKNKLNSLPKLKENRLLEEILLDNNGIEVLSLDNFKKMKNLKLLSLANNSLSTLSNSLLYGELTITNLILSGNMFESIPEAVASNDLPRLESLDLSANALSGELTLSTISALAYLKLLNLNGNHISTVTPDTDVYFWDLERFFISSNNLTKLDSGILDRFPKILEFAADENSIATIDEDSFVNNPLLQKLSLSHNLLKDFGNETLSSLADLEELMLFHNDLTRCPSFFKNVKLKILGLCNNPLGNLENEALHGPEALKSLLLRGTDMTSLKSEALGNISDIEILDLAQNNLSSIPIVIQNMPALRTLKLSENPIETISLEFFKGLYNLREAQFDKMKLSSMDVTELFVSLPSLRYLWLSGNPWRCACEMESFALGVDGSRSRVKIVDRRKMACDSPTSLRGIILDSLDVGDFTQCQASGIVNIQETSAIVRLPGFPESIKKTVSYMPLPGAEKFIQVAKGKRDVLLPQLIPDTNYLVCVTTEYMNGLDSPPTGKRAFPEHGGSRMESCIKFQTLAQSYNKTWTRGSFGGSLATAQQLLLVYLVLGGIICLSVAITSLASIFWYKRRKDTIRHERRTRFESEHSDDSQDTPNDPVSTVHDVVDTTEAKTCPSSRSHKERGNGAVIEMTNRDGCDNLAFDERMMPQRTKL